MAVLIAMLIGGAVALGWPQLILPLAPILKPAFAVTMVAVGTLVTRDQLTTFAAAPSRALVGLAVQYTAMPLLAFAASLPFDDPALRAGIILTGCMPGAMASNVMTVLFRGDLILSVAMTTVATIAAPLVLGFWLPLLADAEMAVPVGAMAWNATWMVALPVAAGILVRRRAGDLPRWWDRTATGIAAAAIVLIILVVVAANRDRLLAVGVALGAAMVALNLTGYLSGYGAARLLRWPAPQRRTLTLEVGLQNAGLGSVLALSHLGEAGAIPSAFYTFLCVATASLALPVMARMRTA